MDSVNQQKRRWRVPVGICPLCQKSRPLIQDHSYETGLCRGRICVGCNTKVGHYEMPAEEVRHLAEYVEAWRQRHATVGGERYHIGKVRSLEARERSRLLNQVRRKARREAKRAA